MERRAEGQDLTKDSSPRDRGKALNTLSELFSPEGFGHDLARDYIDRAQDPRHSEELERRVIDLKARAPFLIDNEVRFHAAWRLGIELVAQETKPPKLSKTPIEKIKIRTPQGERMVATDLIARCQQFYELSQRNLPPYRIAQIMGVEFNPLESYIKIIHNNPELFQTNSEPT